MQIINWKGYLAASLAAAAITVAVCVWWAGKHYQPTIDKLNQQLGACSTARQSAENTVVFQNGKIIQLETESKNRKKEGDAKQDSASLEARGDYSKAQGVLTEQVDMSNECRSAQEAFKIELETERAK